MQTMEFAIKMEVDAAKYYREQAQIFKDYPISRVFEKLVEAELQHQELLENYEKREDIESELTNLSEEDNIYSNLEDFKCDFTLIPKQLEAYRKALDLEQKSIELYSKLLENTTEESTRNLLSFLVNEEKKHYELFEELVKLTKRPEDWVEDAEFGNREEY